MKFYEALGKLVESEIVEGCSEFYLINENWNGLKNNKEMTVQVRDKQEDPMYNMCPYLEMTINTFDKHVDCMPWIPSFLDIFSDKWIVKKYDIKTGKHVVLFQ